MLLCISLESILNTFVWGSSRQTLMAYSEMPCPQLSHFEKVDRIRYSTLICSFFANVVAHHFQILFSSAHGSPRMGNRRHMVFHHCKIWQLAMNITKAPALHTHTPL